MKPLRSLPSASSCVIVEPGRELDGALQLDDGGIRLAGEVALQLRELEQRLHRELHVSRLLRDGLRIDQRQARLLAATLLLEDAAETDESRPAELRPPCGGGLGRDQAEPLGRFVQAAELVQNARAAQAEPGRRLGMLVADELERAGV